MAAMTSFLSTRPNVPLESADEVSKRFGVNYCSDERKPYYRKDDNLPQWVPRNRVDKGESTSSEEPMDVCEGPPAVCEPKRMSFDAMQADKAKRALCMIYSGTAQSTGFLVAPRCVLTVAHAIGGGTCSADTEIEVELGRHGPKVLKRASSKSWAVPCAWRKSETPGLDIGAIFLPDDTLYRACRWPAECGVHQTQSGGTLHWWGYHENNPVPVASKTSKESRRCRLGDERLLILPDRGRTGESGGPLWQSGEVVGLRKKSVRLEGGKPGAAAACLAFSPAILKLIQSWVTWSEPR